MRGTSATTPRAPRRTILSSLHPEDPAGPDCGVSDAADSTGLSRRSVSICLLLRDARGTVFDFLT